MYLNIILDIATCFDNVEAFGGGRSLGGGSRGYNGGSQKSRSGNHPNPLAGVGNEYDRTNYNKKSKEATTQPKSSGRNISTPQIVFILTMIMTLGFAGYYFIQFYPFLCSKESKYDVMSRSSVTPTHSREFEYDESTSSGTKSTNASYSNEHDV